MVELGHKITLETIRHKFTNQTLIIARQKALLSHRDTSVYQKHTLQDAQLSQRDRAAGCVIVFDKSRRLELGDNILRTL